MEFNKIVWGAEVQDGVVTSSDTIIEQKALRRRIDNLKMHYKKVASLSKLCEKPLPNEQIRIITEKQFNAFAVILHILQDEIIEEMNLAIYRINQPTVESIIEFIKNGSIVRANFVISNFFNQTKKPEKWAEMLCDFAQTTDRVGHAYVHNHSKVVCIKTPANYYVFEGSGNMSDNARVEQYLYENCQDSFNFHSEWIKKLCK